MRGRAHSQGFRRQRLAGFYKEVWNAGKLVGKTQVSQKRRWRVCGGGRAGVLVGCIRDRQNRLRAQSRIPWLPSSVCAH